MIEKLASLFFIVIAFTSCQQQNNDAQVKTLLTGLQQSDSMIRKSIWAMEMSFDERSKDPMYYHIDVWHPLAKRIDSLSDNIYAFVDSLDNKLPEKRPAMNDLKPLLFEKLFRYKNDIIDVLYLDDSWASPVLQNDLTTARKNFYSNLPLLATISPADTAGMGQSVANTWFDSTFGNASPLMHQAILSKIKIDILMSQHALQRYCFNKTTYHKDSYEVFHAIATVNSAVIRQGEPLVVTAGVGAFSASMKPTIRIDGKNRQLTADAVAEYQFTPNAKPGKYTLPVEFEYFKPDGQRESLKKKIHYTIVP